MSIHIPKDVDALFIRNHSISFKCIHRRAPPPLQYHNQTLGLILRFDNTGLPQPTGHDLNPCSLRPIAASIVEPSVLYKTSASNFTSSLRAHEKNKRLTFGEPLAFYLSFNYSARSVKRWKPVAVSSLSKPFKKSATEIFSFWQ